MKTYIKKIIQTVIQIWSKYRFQITYLWAFIFMFFLLDGISKNIERIDPTFFIKGVFNNRFVLLFPFVWVVIKYIKLEKIRFSNNKKFFVWFLILIQFLSTIFFIGEQYEIPYYLSKTANFFIFTLIYIHIIRLYYSYDNEALLKLFKITSEEDGKKYKFNITWLFILLLVFGIFIRFVNIDGLYPITDAFPHLVGAKSLLLYAEKIDYRRFDLLTQLLKYLFSIFDMNLVIARLPGIFVSIFFIFVSWLLIKSEVSKNISRIYLLLMSLNPWLIMQSRVIREYIFFIPVYFFLAIYFFKRIKHYFGKQKLFLIPLDITILGALFYYIWKVDSLSTMKIALIFPIFSGLYATFFYLDKKINLFERIRKVNLRKTTLFLIVIFSVILLNQKYLGFQIELSQLHVIPVFNNNWIKFVLFDQTYNTVILSFLLLFFGLIFILKKTRESKKITFESYLLFLFLFVMYVFTFHFERSMAQRYIFFLLPFIVLITSYGLDYVIEFLNKKIKLHIKEDWLLFCFLNWSFILYSFLVQGGGYVKASGNYHEYTAEVFDYVNTKFSDAEVWLVDIPLGFQWYAEDRVTYQKIQNYVYNNPEREKQLRDLMEKYDKGLFVIEKRRNKWAGKDVFPPRDKYFVEGVLKFDSIVSDSYIYYWEK